jgi:hypothetical protein
MTTHQAEEEAKRQAAEKKREAMLKANRRATIVIGVVVVLVSIGALAWLAPTFNATRPIHPDYADAAGAPLVVFAISLVGAAVAGINFVRVLFFKRHAFELEIADAMDDWIWGAVAIGAAWLVGTTIFV